MASKKTEEVLLLIYTSYTIIPDVSMVHSSQ